MGRKYLEIYHHVEHKMIQDVDALADTNQPFDLMEFIYQQESLKILSTCFEMFVFEQVIWEYT